MRKILILSLVLFSLSVFSRTTYNFNLGWRYCVGDDPDQANWKTVTLPRAFNEDETFRIPIAQLTDTIVWYEKVFTLPSTEKGNKVFIEFEGARQLADVWLNGHHLGYSENGVMAFGFDLTSYINYKGKNTLRVRIDNSWDYEERTTKTRYQWNNKNFNVNYGGLTKNVWLHTMPPLYQTLPLLSSLGTTGVYVYASDVNVSERTITLCAESQVKNDDSRAHSVVYEVELLNIDGSQKVKFRSAPSTIAPFRSSVLKASSFVSDVDFWSWGHGALYDVCTSVIIDGKVTDKVVTRTGFRSTRFADGKIWLNNRVMQIHGYAQRTSNEWPGVGMSAPAWLSDYSNALMVKGGANCVRWMHVTPWKQDVESCDRVGLPMSMQAGDAEKDCQGRQWQQRLELMADAIVYNRNNPSILFYESGNESISREHMLQMRSLRDKYDPHGGRAIGSREMLDIREAEYGGEMLYINKSAHSPMWAQEYCRDEGLRKYWDSYSYPYHPEGKGPLYRGADASDYNHNQDMFAVEQIRRWYDYWRERPGTGTRCSSGGVKIVFSDTQTHCRGEENYRRSGVVDAMRIPKDSYYALQAVWDCWCDQERPHTYIIGHWNYSDTTVKPVYVVSNSHSVELLLNGRSLGIGKCEYDFLHTFPSVRFETGTLVALGRSSDGRIESSDTLYTAGTPAAMRMSVLTSPTGLHADGADVALVEYEIVDAQGRRCPLDNRLVNFSLSGPAEWLGGIAQGDDNCVFSTSLPVECGVNRVLVRSTQKSGTIRLTASAEGLPSQSVTIVSRAVRSRGGLTEYAQRNELHPSSLRGATPEGESMKQRRVAAEIASITSGANQESVFNSVDDNELSEWANDGQLSTAWITYNLQQPARVNDICLKLTGWRMRQYPLEVFAGDSLVWSGLTPVSLGYVHLPIDSPVLSDVYTIRLKGASSSNSSFSKIVELDQENKKQPAEELDLYKSKNGSKVGGQLRIVEIEFLVDK